MAELSEYKCPACGGAMEFDSISQNMKCPYCDTEMTVAQYNEMMKKETAEGGQQNEPAEAVQNTQNTDSDEMNYWSESETAGMRIYGCESCGGEIVASETLGATTCPYCGNNVVMKGQFKGDLKPDFIIPFKKDKKMAKEAYYKHLEKKPFLPKVFRDENHIDEIKGVYVPFWLYDAEVSGNMSYSATRVHSVKHETATHITTITTTDHFLLERSGVAAFNQVPADGSSKMDDALMDSIEPFDFHDMVPFNAAYMAGYLAERYDVTAQECVERAKTRMKHTTEERFYSTTGGYATVNSNRNTLNVRTKKIKYALFPVWILNTTWQDNHYIFAMNGQNGNLVGDLPCDEKAYRKYAFTRGGIIGLIILIIYWIFMLGKL